MKHPKAWSKKNWALGQPRATQSAMHETFTCGGRELVSMQLVEQVSIWMQPIVSHCPQSCEQFVHVS
jgi:hypothetical protein